MVQQQIIHCPYCNATDLYKNGKSRNGIQRWYCKECKKYFQLDYLYNACKHGTKEKIIELTMNSCGVRDTGRILSISKDTVTAVLKKNSKREPLFSDTGRSQKE